jgi:uncharacterized cupin superfamily protein
MPKKIDIATTKRIEGSRYPAPFDQPCNARVRQVLGDAAGLTQFGVNLCRLSAGAWSSQRHWHTAEDEFVYVLEGTVTLVSDAGEEILRPGDCVGFKAGASDGHHLQNRSDRDALFLEIGTRREQEDQTFYPDIDLHAPEGAVGYTHKDATKYPARNPQ